MARTIAMVVLLISALASGCASSGAVGAGGVAAPTRGDVLVAGASVKAVVLGPIAVHAYSAFAGGALYAARAVSGSDADCQGAAEVGPRSELRADTVVNFTVGAGQIACLATSTNRSFELLWHAQKGAALADQTLMARNDRSRP
jgi:hypothetical protein